MGCGILLGGVFGVVLVYIMIIGGGIVGMNVVKIVVGF